MQARAHTHTHTHAGSRWFTPPTPRRLVCSDVIHGSFTVKHRLRFDCLVGNEDDEEVDELEEIIDLHYDRRTADTEAPAPIIKNPRVRLPSHAPTWSVAALEITPPTRLGKQLYRVIHEVVMHRAPTAIPVQLVGCLGAAHARSPSPASPASLVINHTLPP